MSMIFSSIPQPAWNMPPSRPTADSRAAELGEVLQGWRSRGGLKRPEVVRRMRHNGRTITDDYLSKLEYGIKNLARAGLDVRESLRLALGVSTSEWTARTGLLVPENAPEPAGKGITLPLNEYQSAGGWDAARASSHQPQPSAHEKAEISHSTPQSEGTMVLAPVSSGTPDHVRVAVYGTAVLGAPGNFTSEANVIGHELIPRDEYRNGNTVSMYATGDSMTPTILDGELVIADKSLTDLQDGKLYMILVEGEGLCIKRARFNRGEWWLFSDNPAYLPFQVAEATIVGQVYYGQPRGKHY